MVGSELEYWNPNHVLVNCRKNLRCTHEALPLQKWEGHGGLPQLYIDNVLTLLSSFLETPNRIACQCHEQAHADGEGLEQNSHISV